MSSSHHMSDEEVVLMSTIKGNAHHNHLTSVIYCNHQCLLLAPRLGINPPERSLMSARLPFGGRKVSDLFPVLIRHRYWFGQVKWSYSARRTASFSHLTLYTPLKMRFQNKVNVKQGSVLLQGSYFELIHALIIITNIIIINTLFFFELVSDVLFKPHTGPYLN